MSDFIYTQDVPNESTAIEADCINQICQNILSDIRYYIYGNGPYCLECLARETGIIIRR